MKKLGVFLILGALCTALLAGCGTPSEVPDSSVVSSAASNMEGSTAPSSSETTSDASSESASDAPAITIQLQDYTGDNIGEFPIITGVENEAVSTINQEIEQRLASYQKHLQNDDGSWMEIKAYPIATSRYLNIVFTDITYPIYGTQGTAYSYNYDIANKTIVSLDDALSLANITKEDIVSASSDYIENMREYLEVTSIDMDAFAINEDGSVDFFIRIFTDNVPDTPNIAVTGSSNALYTYHAADQSITPYTAGTELIPGAGLSK